MRLRRRPRVTPDQVLQSRPVRGEGLETEPLEDGGLRIVIRRRQDWWIRLLSLVFHIPGRRSIELDAVGREVWELCDGEHTLRDMTVVFQERHKLTRAEAEWSLRTYLRDLGKRRLVGFAVDNRSQEQGEQTHGTRA